MPQLPFTKDEYYQLLNNILQIPQQAAPLATSNSLVDKIRQVVLNQGQPAMTAMAGTIQ